MTKKYHKLTLKERAVHWWTRQCEINEASLASDIAEIRQLMHDINVRIPGTPEYNAEREREARLRDLMRGCVADVARLLRSIDTTRQGATR